MLAELAFCLDDLEALVGSCPLKEQCSRRAYTRQEQLMLLLTVALLAHAG